nr:ribonuclease H-like domain-containing protein [Tanacetum cinerariifolium]
MSGEEPAPQMAPVESPQIVSSVKLPILKKGEYILWSMRMEPYLINTNYGLWQVIMNGDEHVQTTRDENGVETKVPPNTAQAILARQRERKAKSILLLAIPDEYQLRFHTIKDAKSLWDAIKSRFAGNVESKKMQKTVLKQQFENFYVSNTEGLYKAYDRNKEGIDELDIDDLYNNLKVFEADIKAAGHSSSRQASSSSYNDDLMFSFFSSQSNSPQLDNEDLEQIDHDDLEEIDLKWKVAMLSLRNMNGDARYRNRDNNKRTVPVESSNALVVQDNALIVQDGLGYNWSYITQEEPTEFALMAYTLGSDTEKNEVAYEEKIAILEFKVKDKGYGDQLSESDSDGDDNPTNDRFKIGLDDSVYRPTVNKASASISKVEPSVIKTSNISVEMPKVDSMRTRNKALLTNYQDIDGGFVAFGGSIKGGKITENSVLFTESECLVLSSDYKLIDESQVLLRVPRQNNMYNFDLKNVVPSGDLTCLFIKATTDKSNHMRLGHVNFKTMNKLVKGNLVRGLLSKIFENDHTCVACQKGKQHKAFYSLLPTIFWAEAVNTACYVLNRVLVTKPHNKTPYELIIGRPPRISFVRPFGCPVTILNTLDPLGKFVRKAEEGFLVGYSVNNKAFRVFNTQTKKVEENMHVNFLKNKPNVVKQGPNWLFDIDSLANSMNYQPVTTGNQANKNVGHQEVNGDTGLKKNVNVGHTKQEKVST